MAEIQERFQEASERMRKNTRLKLSNEQKLELYALFKQANEGPCNTSKPGMFDFTGRAKWEAWHKLGNGVSKEVAMSRYVELVGRVDPEWETQPLDTSQLPPAASGGGGSGGPVVSTLASSQEEEVIPDDKKTVFDWCKEGNISSLTELVTESNVNNKDSQGMALLHWACDRGNLEVVKLLVSIREADVNIQDSDQQTPLHYAASCDQVEVVSFLLTVNGVDASLKDCDGCTAEEVAAGNRIKQLFHQSTTP